MSASISCVVLTKNEEQNISRCLRSVSWCDEVLVVDDYSTDRTPELIQKAKIRCLRHALDGNFSQQRNFALDNVSNDWVLFVDADEEISLSLQYEITSYVNDQFMTFDGFFIKRVDEIWGKKLTNGDVRNAYKLRLAKKSSGRWTGNVHEVWNIKGKIGKLQNHIIHYPHPTVKAFLSDINHYSDIRANELISEKVPVYRWQILAYPLGKFVSCFIIQAGFIDGIPGLVHATMMSFYTFLVRGKAWLAYEKKKR